MLGAVGDSFPSLSSNTLLENRPGEQPRNELLRGYKVRELGSHFPDHESGSQRARVVLST